MRGSTQKLTIQYVCKQIEADGNVCQSTEYKNTRTKLKVLFCRCGHSWYISWDRYQQGRRCGHLVCLSKAKSEGAKLQRQLVPLFGRNSPVWKDNPSSDFRELNTPGIREWVLSVFRRDDFTCQKCGQKSGAIEAHHIQPYSLFEKERLNLDNGMTLCKLHHAEYHTIWGKITRCNLVTLTDWLAKSCESTALTAAILKS